MVKGIVKWWNDSKGYGFIQVGERDVYCHFSVISGDGFKTLYDKENQEVELEIQEGPKGPQASKVIK